MVDYVKVATAGTTNLALASAWTPAGGPPVSVTADTATWNATSLGGSLSGNFTTRKVTINGATANIVHSGTITLGADGFEFAAANNRQWSQTGVVAVGASNQTWRLNNAGLGMQLSAAGGLTGSAVVLITNNSTSQSMGNAYIVFTGACTGFTGTLELSDNVALYTNNATGALTACNVLVSGVAMLAPNVSGQVLGSAAKTLTFNANALFGEPDKASFKIAYAVALGSVTRTLTANGNTTMSGTVTGTAGFIKTGAADLQLTGANTISGTLTASVGSLVVGPYNSGTPNNIDNATSLVCNSGTFFWGINAYTFAKPFSGSGTIGTNNSNTVTLSDDASVSAFTGTYNPTCDDTVNGRLRLNAFPSSASALIPQVFSTGSNARTATLALYHAAPSSTSAIVYVFAANTSTGGVSVLEDNGTASSTYNGIVTNLPGSNAGATLRLRLQGTNTDATYAGQIQATNASGKLGLTKDGTGKWLLSGSNLYDGNTLISAGTLTAQSASALGSATAAGGVTISGTGTLELSGGITLNKSSTAFTIHQTSPIVSVGDNTVRTAGVTLGGTTTFEVTTGNRLAISNTGAITDGASTFGITKTGDGELALGAFSNTYDGAVTVSAGTLAIGSVGALGTGVATVQVTGNLKYTGAAATLSRATQLNGASPSLEASGTGALTVSNLSQDVATKTVTLKGTNTDANTITSGLSNNSGILSLVKEGTGEWVLSGARSYTGTTTVSEGTLRLESTNSATTSGAVTIATGSTVELITNTLASSGAGAGEVLGTSNVTCNGGTIKTRSGALQKAQVRYGGNLTLGAGTMYYIGAAA